MDLNKCDKQQISHSSFEKQKKIGHLSLKVLSLASNCLENILLWTQQEFKIVAMPIIGLMFKRNLCKRTIIKLKLIKWKALSVLNKTRNMA